MRGPFSLANSCRRMKEKIYHRKVYALHIAAYRYARFVIAARNNYAKWPLSKKSIIVITITASIACIFVFNVHNVINYIVVMGTKMG